VFCIYLRTNSDLCHLQHKLIGFYNRDEKCLQRGTDWVFKHSSLRFVFKGLRISSAARQINPSPRSGQPTAHYENLWASKQSDVCRYVKRRLLVYTRNNDMFTRFAKQTNILVFSRMSRSLLEYLLKGQRDLGFVIEKLLLFILSQILWTV
jgi:hypothetical protein